MPFDLSLSWYQIISKFNFIKYRQQNVIHMAARSPSKFFEHRLHRNFAARDSYFHYLSLTKKQKKPTKVSFDHWQANPLEYVLQSWAWELASNLFFSFFLGGGAKLSINHLIQGHRLHSRPAQYLFGKLGQTPWRTLGQEVIAYQFLLKSNNVQPPLW